MSTPEIDLPDGIYFNLSHDEYLALPRLSASGYKSLLESPGKFWASSWLNKHKVARPHDARRENAFKIGTAYHCARLEPERFAEEYVRGFDPEDLIDETLEEDQAGNAVLMTDEEVKAQIAKIAEQLIADKIESTPPKEVPPTDADCIASYVGRTGVPISQSVSGESAEERRFRLSKILNVKPEELAHLKTDGAIKDAIKIQADVIIAEERKRLGVSLVHLTDREAKAAVEEELGVPLAQAPKGEDARARALRLLELGYDGKVLLLERERFAAMNEGKIELDAAIYDQISADAKILDAIPEIAEDLRGGAYEVSVLWTCPESGLPQKCRFDVLKSDMWIDLKTYENGRGKELEQLIADNFRFLGYYITFAHYHEAAEVLRTGKLEIRDEATPLQRSIIDELGQRDDYVPAWFCCMEKFGVPNIFMRQAETHFTPWEEMPIENAGNMDELAVALESGKEVKTALLLKGERDIFDAKAKFIRYRSIYPDGEPWIYTRTKEPLKEALFNPFWLGAEE